ncbi:unnamed protein product [Arctogadus glacialis]
MSKDMRRERWTVLGLTWTYGVPSENGTSRTRILFWGGGVTPSAPLGLMVNSMLRFDPRLVQQGTRQRLSGVDPFCTTLPLSSVEKDPDSGSQPVNDRPRGEETPALTRDVLPEGGGGGGGGSPWWARMELGEKKRSGRLDRTVGLSAPLPQRR